LVVAALATALPLLLLQVSGQQFLCRRKAPIYVLQLDTI
jgi:hypothetical protein